MMAGVAVFMVGAGVWVGLGARRLVGSLTAIPVTGGGLRVRMEGRRILPFLSPKILEADVNTVSLTAPTAPIAAGLPFASTPGSASAFYNDITGEPQPRRPLNAAAMKRVQEAQRLRDREKETLFQTITGPPRRLLGAGFRGIGRVVAREGFVGVRVGKAGGVWRVDARDGWLVDGGVGVDRLLRGR